MGANAPRRNEQAGSSSDDQAGGSPPASERGARKLRPGAMCRFRGQGACGYRAGRPVNVWPASALRTSSALGSNRAPFSARSARRRETTSGSPSVSA
jgi:hypothetical protein